MNYYNENDPKAAAWLRELIKGGHIAPGEVDERSIRDVRADDLRGFVQCHFFAGIGGWSYALRLAGWPDDEAVWTGSCPCQPFSSAGKAQGLCDERHLWPAFRGLIAKRHPAIVFGEQVASKDGRAWLAGVRSDLEGDGYAVGAADLCAAGVAAPHQRQRLYWVAHSNVSSEHKRASSGKQSVHYEMLNRAKGMDNGHGDRRQTRGSHHQKDERHEPATTSIIGAQKLEHAAPTRLQGEWREYRPSGERCSGLVGLAVQTSVPEWNGPTIAIECSDGPRRASSQPNAFPLANGVPARMVKLRGSGNAIVPQVAAEFIRAYLET